jgi:hypothetical protein
MRNTDNNKDKIKVTVIRVKLALVYIQYDNVAKKKRGRVAMRPDFHFYRGGIFSLLYKPAYAVLK